MVNYNNSVIYKLCCKDVNVKEVYVGSTTNFNRRRQSHKECCYKENRVGYLLPVYCFIRANGDWENWDMVEIEKYSCNDKRELHTRERYWIEQSCSTLNKVIPTRTEKEHYENNKQKIAEKQKKYNSQNWYCSLCDKNMTIGNKSKHLKTKNHILNSNLDNIQ